MAGGFGALFLLLMVYGRGTVCLYCMTRHCTVCGPISVLCNIIFLYCIISVLWVGGCVYVCTEYGPISVLCAPM